MNAAGPYLDALDAMAPLVAAEAGQSERAARATAAVVERIVDAGLFRLWVPRSVDAPELELPSALEVFEAASRIDGSFGWAVTIGTGGGLFAAFLEPATAAEVFGPREAVIAGSGSPSGTARPVDSGYLAGGRWSFASGAHHATWFTANCVLEGERGAEPDGAPVIRAMTFPASEVEIIENWDPAGMRGTGSHDFRVDSSLVPFRRTFSVFDDTPFEHGPLYRYPFASIAEVSFGAVALGIGRNAIDELMALAGSHRSLYTGELLRDRQVVRARLGEAEALVSSARAWFYEVAQSSWDTIVRGESLSVSGGRARGPRLHPRHRQRGPCLPAALRGRRLRLACRRLAPRPRLARRARAHPARGRESAGLRGRRRRTARPRGVVGSRGRLRAAPARLPNREVQQHPRQDQRVVPSSLVTGPVVRPLCR